MRKFLQLLIIAAFVSCDLAEGLGTEDDTAQQSNATAFVEVLSASSNAIEIGLRYKATEPQSFVFFDDVDTSEFWVADAGSTEIGVCNEDANYKIYEATFKFQENTSPNVREIEMAFSVGDDKFGQTITVVQSGTEQNAGVVVDLDNVNRNELSKNNCWIVEGQISENQLSTLSDLIISSEQPVSLVFETASDISSFEMTEYGKYVEYIYAPNLFIFTLLEARIKQLIIPNTFVIHFEYDNGFVNRYKHLTMATDTLAGKQVTYMAESVSGSLSAEAMFADTELITAPYDDSTVDGCIWNVAGALPGTTVALGPFKSINSQRTSQGPFYCYSLPVDLTQFEGTTLEILDSELDWRAVKYLMDFLNSSDNLIMTDPESGEFEPKRVLDLYFPNLVEFKTDDPTFCEMENIRSFRAPLLEELPMLSFNGIFESCKNLVEVDMPLVSIIHAKCFLNCELLETVNIPGAMAIMPLSFANCSSIKNLYIPKADYIGDYSFGGCSALESITFGTDIEKVEMYHSKMFDIEEPYVDVDVSNITLTISELDGYITVNDNNTVTVDDMGAYDSVLGPFKKVITKF